VTTYHVSFAPEALRQLVAIDEYLTAAGVPDSQFVFSIVDYCESLATFPQRGRDRSDIDPGLRITGYKKRVAIAYTVDADTVNILGVFTAGRTTKHTSLTNSQLTARKPYPRLKVDIATARNVMLRRSSGPAHPISTPYLALSLPIQPT